MIRRGEVRWANLGDPHGSSPAGRRPVLVVSADSYNASRIRTVVCAVLTTNLRLGDAPGNVVLGPETTGLPERSVVNVSQLVTLDKELLSDPVGMLDVLDDAALERVEAGIRRVLALA